MSYADYLGRQETRADHVSPLLLHGLAATIDRPEPEELPPLWHWTLFQEWAPASALGDDGHLKRGGFLPPVHDLPRRMWAGGRLRFLAPLRAGEAVKRVSTIRRIDEKAGASGRLVFVTVGHVITGDGGVAIEEEHDIVYRGSDGPAVKRGTPGSPLPAGARSRTIVPDAVMLFRYSALTGNGHRIHYDLDYVTRVEGYPGLVVHGPLQATLLAGLLTDFVPDARLSSFSFRGRRPAFHGRPLTLACWRDRDGYALETRDQDGMVCMSAEARLA
ncbi:FAS1-like dehydratase domain-containing protein [Acidisphaera rubrifaciens]|nr:MaoC family dehydratase N-terminal domain-containing protein [Acidisphaera rubrifaciens]